MFKTIVTVLVSMMMTAGAAVGLDVDQSQLMSKLRSRASQPTRVDAEVAADGVGLQGGSEMSAGVASKSRTSQDGQGDHEQSTEAEGKAESSVRVESRVDSENLKQLWARIRARIEAAVKRVKDEARKIGVNAGFQGAGRGSLEADGADRISADASSEGSASGETTFSGEENGFDAGLVLPILEGSLDVRNEWEGEGEVNSSGQ